ncbi:oxygenase MpaB family protein [Paenarthrobacter sp. NPDC058040]|uniref:oxygenase MpaB family protein n=1 Tax=unclassified Paenarthrobacter TaxID=2634190 RepID=UPI0036DC93B4
MNKVKESNPEITESDILGTERRWRRGMEPVAAGDSYLEDGSPDYGLFGPGSMVWEVLLHPATVVFHHVGQVLAQDTYAPIVAGIRDHEPVVRKGREGTLTTFDGFERASRGAGIHGIMWLGDTKTATTMANFLHKVHTKVAGDIIDVSQPELGGYAAAQPREAMWAALTEMHPMLRMYEAFAFRDGQSPRRLSDEQRDQFIKECAPYLRAHGAPEEEIPTSMTELKALYKKYDKFFFNSDSLRISPEYGYDYMQIMKEAGRKNFIPSHQRAAELMNRIFHVPRKAAIGALPHRARLALGLSPAEEADAVAEIERFQETALQMQQPENEQEILRLMWGPDGVRLFESARNLHRKVLAERGSGVVTG